MGNSRWFRAVASIALGSAIFAGTASAKAGNPQSNAGQKTPGARTAKSTKATPSATASKKSGTAPRTAKGKRSRRKSRRPRGQQAIDSARATEIQQALIREKYLDGEPTGLWDQRTKDAMARYQAVNGWQTKVLPDSRALIKLGLGPDHSNLINPETAATTPHAATTTTGKQ